MSQRAHKLFIGSMVVFTIAVVATLAIYGWNYYRTPVPERNLHALHELLSPVGFIGHGLGFAGTLLMIAGVALYSSRKRLDALQSFGRIKHVLEFHIFLCLLGPALILFHTAFKFGGLVGLSFWCMTLVVLSGVIGRFLYLRIPKTMTGKEISPVELKEQAEALRSTAMSEHGVPDAMINSIDETLAFRLVDGHSVLANIPRFIRHAATFERRRARLFRSQKSLSIEASHLLTDRARLLHQLDGLMLTQRLFRYWHLFHLPLAIVMLIITIIHTIIAFLFGYGWIFTDGWP